MQIQSELGDEEEGHDDGGDEGDDAAGERAAVEILVDLGVRVQVPELAENAVHLRLGYNLPPKPPKKKRKKKKKSSVGGGDFPRSLSLSLLPAVEFLNGIGGDGGMQNLSRNASLNCG